MNLNQQYGLGVACFPKTWKTWSQTSSISGVNQVRSLTQTESRAQPIIRTWDIHETQPVIWTWVVEFSRLVLRHDVKFNGQLDKTGNILTQAWSTVQPIYLQQLLYYKIGRRATFTESQAQPVSGTWEWSGCRILMTSHNIARTNILRVLDPDTC